MRPSLTMQRFGEKLRTLRTRQGMTIRELANALGYGSYSHIGDVEIGRKMPSLAFAIKVSRLFAVSVDQLVKDELEVDANEQP